MRWARLAVGSAAAGGRRRMPPAQRNWRGFPMCLHLPSRLYGIQVRPEHKRCQNKRRKRIDRYSPCSPTLFLVAGSPFGTNFVCPLSSQIYIVRTTKIAGPSLQNTPFSPMLFNYFNIFKSFKCFKGAINPRHTCVPKFKGDSLRD